MDHWQYIIRFGRVSMIAIVASPTEMTAQSEHEFYGCPGALRGSLSRPSARLATAGVYKCGGPWGLRYAQSAVVGWRPVGRLKLVMIAFLRLRQWAP